MNMRGFVLVVGALLAVGCARKTYVGPNGETVSQSGNTTHIETPQGSADITQNGSSYKATDNKGNSMEMNANAVSEADLGVPFYPGSKDTPSSMKITSNGKTAFSSMRTTTDDPSKVLDFYTQKLGKPDSTATTGQMATASWGANGPKPTAIIASSEKGVTNIQITVTQK